MYTVIKNITNDRIVPILLVSNVTGENLDLLKMYLNVAPPRIQWDILRDKPAEVLIDQTYFVTGVGTVVGGTVMSGVIRPNTTLLLGPDSNGVFVQATIKSIHSKKIPVEKVVAGQTAGFALKKIKRSSIRKGMVIIDESVPNRATWIFEADVIVLFHSTTIHKNYQPVIQCMAMRQSAKITHIYKKEVLRTGDRSKVRFRFLYHPEYLKVGMRLIFREGRCKGIGIITSINPTEEPEENIEPGSEETNNEQVEEEDNGKNETNNEPNNEQTSTT